MIGTIGWHVDDDELSPMRIVNQMDVKILIFGKNKN